MTDLLHLGPSGRNILTELDIKELLARLALDGVLLGRENALGSIDLEVDLIGQSKFT